MFTKTADILETQTYIYWKLSYSRAGRSKDKITFEKFAKALNDLEFNLGPSRALLRSVKGLSEAIVVGKSKRQKKLGTLIELPSRTVTGGINA